MNANKTKKDKTFLLRIENDLLNQLKNKTKSNKTDVSKVLRAMIASYVD